jgi:uncharacterized protein (TIGR02996 family)
MAEPLTLTDEYVYRIAPDGKSAQSALELVARGAFRAAKMSDDGRRLDAQCEGSERTPYKVSVDLTQPKRPRTGCDCPSYKRPCKHALGLIFLAVRSPEVFELAGAAAEEGKGKKSAAPLQAAAVRKVEDTEKRPPADVGEALLQAILAEPEDDTPRLVYADWLEENGGAVEQARADFIRVQCELARLPEHDPRSQELRAREKALWAKHRGAFQEGIPPHLRRKEVLFRRGFLDELDRRSERSRWGPRKWLAHAEALFALHPIHRLRLECSLTRHVAGALAVVPSLARLRVLRLHKCDISEPSQTLRILFGTPFLSGMRRLEVRASALAARGLVVLAESPLLERLRELDLEDNGIGPRGAQALAESPKSANLRELSLAKNPLGDAGARALAASEHLAGLERLDLRDVTLGYGAQAALRERFDERVMLD